ncbi:MAG: PD40 domain-containing protein, partial [Anaerolineae bacterium]|nr:PD40 domain-containing protein [Anaerolineae bacterium]
MPSELPPVAGLDKGDEYAPGHRPRAWLWTLLAALTAVLLAVYLVVLGAKAIYDGLRDRGIVNQQTAREHYDLGMAHLEAGEYELAVAELKLALRYDSKLVEAQTQLREAEAKARAQVTPTSEARLDAAALLYRQAVTAYESGKLAEAITALDELRGLDGDYQRQNVETMVTTAHYQLGLDAVRGDRLDEAVQHFEVVLALKPDDGDARDQLNLVNLYKAALSNWDQNWPATIQALKGLYALAPGYKDVRIRLHDAHVYLAQAYSTEGDWCAASEEYAAAVSTLSLEGTVDKRDDAAFRCQATAEAPPPTATQRPQPTATSPAAAATSAVETTATPGGATGSLGQGRIAFTSYDATLQRHDVYVLDLAQGPAALAQENASQPALAPGGRLLAFRNTHPSYLGLSVLSLDSREISQVTVHLEDSTPVWSLDGKQIVFASNKHGDRKWRIYVISPGEVRGEGEEWIFGQMPAWSPAASGDSAGLLAYHGCNERGDECGVWVMKAGGFDPARLTTDPSDTAPAWSPDGKRVAFISARSGNWELYVIDA